MTTKLNMRRDINGYNSFGLDFSDANYSATITVGVARALTVPGAQLNVNYLAVFSFEPGAFERLAAQ